MIFWITHGIAFLIGVLVVSIGAFAMALFLDAKASDRDAPENDGFDLEEARVENPIDGRLDRIEKTEVRDGQLILITRAEP